MASLDAQNVGKEVLETLGKGKKVVLGNILRKNGYAKKTSLNPQNVTRTKSFKSVVDPIVESMIKERDRVMKAMMEKDLSEVQYDKLSKVNDELTKNIQLLTGGTTENTGVGELSELLNSWINSKK